MHGHRLWTGIAERSMVLKQGTESGQLVAVRIASKYLRATKLSVRYFSTWYGYIFKYHSYSLRLPLQYSGTYSSTTNDVLGKTQRYTSYY